jgi:hypothetical protein
VISFVGLASGWSQPRLQQWRERRVLPLPRAAEVLLGALGFFVFVVCVYAGLAGSDSVVENLAPTAVYVAFWVGVPFVTLLFGDVFRLVSPWRAVGRVTGWLVARAARGTPPEPLAYPERLGRWPAVAGILGFVICELCWADAKQPATLAIIMLAYFAFQLVGMSVYGVEAWTRRGDAFGVWFGLIALLAPVGRRAGSWIVLRPPVVAATRLNAVPGTTALLLTAIGSTAFDGASEGPLFTGLIGDIQDAFSGLGLSLATSLELAFIVCLLLTIAGVGLVWTIAVLGMPRRQLRLSHLALSRRFVHTLIPIAAAYLVAHYFSLLAYNGQTLWPLASDPLGDGSNLLGGAGKGIDYSILTATAIWYVQVGALVPGHVAGLVLAHDRALTVYGSHKDAVASQVVMLVVMVIFTILGVWLLSAALNT